MDATSHTILEQARAGSPHAWAFLDRHFRRFIVGFFRNHGVRHEDADDLCQDVLTVILKQIREFDHNGRTGAFRAWVRGICLNRLRDHRRLGGNPAAEGGTEHRQMLEQQADDTDLDAEWNRAHDRHVLKLLMEQLASEFEESTLTAFRRLTLEGASGEEVAAELKMTVGAAYVAKSRVLRRLRQLAAGLVDDVAQP